MKFVHRTSYAVHHKCMKQSSKTIILFSLVLIVGILSGFAGSFFSRYFIDRLPLISDLYLPTQGQLGQKEVIIQEAKKVVVEQDVRVGQVLDQTKKPLYGVYHKKAVGKTVSDQLYTPADFVAGAVAVTSDGWLVSHFEGGVLPASYVIIKDNLVIAPEKIISDQASGLKFIKVTGVNLSVAEFATIDNISSGQSVLAYDILSHASKLSQIVDARYRLLQTKADYIYSADLYDQKMLLAETLGKGFIGAPVFNLNGEVVGLSGGDNTVIKIGYVNFLLKSVLRDGTIQKPYLGFSYVDLSYAQGLSETYPILGVLVVKNAAGVSVARDSSLANQLKEGDIITAIENTTLNSDHSFADLLYDYKMGNEVTFKVLRGKETLEVKYTLVEKK